MAKFKYLVEYMAVILCSYRAAGAATDSKEQSNKVDDLEDENENGRDSPLPFYIMMGVIVFIIFSITFYCCYLKKKHNQMSSEVATVKESESSCDSCIDDADNINQDHITDKYANNNENDFISEGIV